MNPLAQLRRKPGNPQPESKPVEEEPSFLRTGDAAFQAVATQSFRTAAEIFNHEKPSTLAFNPHADMTALTGAQVAQALQFFTGMHAYAICECAKVDAEMTAVDFQLRVLRKKLTVEAMGAKRKKYDIDASIEMDTRFMELSEMRAQLGIKRAALEATSKGLEEKASCMSRELTRREGEGRLVRNRP
jgi:hypothetical protein